nr:phage/plasmid primase, P4 family [Actinomycetota bacterium]
EENNIKCSPPLPWREVAAIAKSVGRYAPGSLPRTDTGNAERLVGRHGHDLKFVYGLGWFVWNGTHWRRDKTGEVERRAKETVRSIHEEAARVTNDEERRQLAKWAIASESVSRIRSMVSLAMSEPGIPVGEVEELDRDAWLLNVKNGTLDLRTGGLREHRREDLITKLAPVEYDPGAEAPTWEAFLERALPSESVRAFIQRAVGYSLTGVVGEKVLPFLYGPGDTGKTTFVETVMNLMGDDYAQPAAPDLLLAKRGGNYPTELADLLGKRFVAAVEVEQGRRLAESLVKQLTGGDRIKARFMREDFFDFKPTHKVWFAANHRPDVRETGNAIWNRIKLVPFDVVIPKARQDRRLTEKLRAESAGILAWAVRGCLEWQREGLGEPEEVAAATAEYREDMDPLADFFSEWCVVGPEEWTSKKDLQSAYKSWADWAGRKPLDWNFVADRLKELGCTKKRRHAGHGWAGIGLRPVEPSEESRESDMFDVTG